jgi:hypothetical protein
VHGHFAGEPGLADARAARRAIAYLLRKQINIAAIVLIRDADNQIQRKQGLEQARESYASACRIIVGLALRERESWVICGFEPNDADEDARLGSERKNLGFDPRTRSEQLTAGKVDSALKSPKRVLAALTQNDKRRERDCWAVTPLSVLRDRGQRNGLTDYISEIQSRLAPLITGSKLDRQDH